MIGRPRSTSPKRDQLIKILVTPDLDALVTLAAKREGRSVSDWGQRLFEREVTDLAARDAVRAAPGESRRVGR